MAKEDIQAEEGAGGGSAPWALLVVSWLVPGIGHLVLGRRVRAAVFATVIVAATITGLLLKGELAMPRPGAPFSWLAFLACLGNGGLFLLGKLLGLGHGDVTSAGFGYGNTFLITAGLMNLLTVLDVSDIARGAKS
jgi:hypothetical protein